MRVLIACEYSGRVRDAFLALGHDAVSADLLPTESPGPHYLGDVRDILGDGWDLMVAHPPCTDLATSGSRWWGSKVDSQREALGFVRALMDAPIPRIAVENPRSLIGSAIRPADQQVHPSDFGDPFHKLTFWWLQNLPLLRPTLRVAGAEWVTKVGPGANRWRERSRTFPGMAAAIADQWGSASVERCGVQESLWAS